MTALLGVLAQAGAAAENGYKSPSVWSYVVAGWIIVILGMALYALLVVRKGRELARQLPPEDRRWMS